MKNGCRNCSHARYQVYRGREQVRCLLTRLWMSNEQVDADATCVSWEGFCTAPAWRAPDETAHYRARG